MTQTRSSDGAHKPTVVENGSIIVFSLLFFFSVLKLVIVMTPNSASLPCQTAPHYHNKLLLITTLNPPLLSFKPPFVPLFTTQNRVLQRVVLLFRLVRGCVLSKLLRHGRVFVSCDHLHHTTPHHTTPHHLCSA